MAASITAWFFYEEAIAAAPVHPFVQSCVLVFLANLFYSAAVWFFYQIMSNFTWSPNDWLESWVYKGWNSGGCQLDEASKRPMNTIKCVCLHFPTDNSNTILLTVSTRCFFDHTLELFKCIPTKIFGEKNLTPFQVTWTRV